MHTEGKGCTVESALLFLPAGPGRAVLDPLQGEPTESVGIRPGFSEDRRERTGGKERPFTCQAVLDSRERMGALPSRTLHFSCEEREF